MIPLVFELWPGLRERLPLVELGQFPTPVQQLAGLERALVEEGAGAGRSLYVKRDDLSSPIYGGNKVRTLEVLMGAAQACGAREIVATGALGSNHAVATLLHASRAGLAPGVILFPQPKSWAALENARISLTHAAHVTALRHWSALPYAIWRARDPRRYIMAPGGATPEGALGYVAAALELAQQVRDRELPAPARVYVGVGSTCTSAGLLVGFRHARELGLLREAPTLVSVRVTPWPVTSRFRILRLAERAAALLAELTAGAAPRFSAAELGRRFLVDGREIGAGYGQPTPAGGRAAQLMSRVSELRLDSTYSEKSMAGFIRAAREPVSSAPEGPLVYWATKSSAPLPEPRELGQSEIAPHFRRWLERAREETQAS